MSDIHFPLNFDRTFQLWSYNVSHSVLLLRSNIDRSSPTRIDVMFRAVEELSLRYRYDGLKISVAESVHVNSKVDRYGYAARKLRFELISENESAGHILAGSIHIAEDDLSDGESTSIGEPDLRAHILDQGSYDLELHQRRSS